MIKNVKILGASIEQVKNLCLEVAESLGWWARNRDTLPLGLRHPSVGGGSQGLLWVSVSSSPGGASATIDGKDAAARAFAEALELAAGSAIFPRLDDPQLTGANQVSNEASVPVAAGEAAHKAAGWHTHPIDKEWEFYWDGSDWTGDRRQRTGASTAALPDVRVTSESLGSQSLATPAVLQRPAEPSSQSNGQLITILAVSTAILFGVIKWGLPALNHYQCVQDALPNDRAAALQEGFSTATQADADRAEREAHNLAEEACNDSGQ